MTFLTECFISAAFFGSSIYMMTVDDDKKDALYNEMKPETRVHYDKIKKERMKIFGIATGVAFIMATMVNQVGASMIPSARCNDCFNKSCISTATYFFTQYMVYSLYPKSDWVLNHIENKEQAKLWLKKYNYMKNKWHAGLLLGIIGYFLGTYFLNLKVEKDGFLMWDPYDQTINPYPDGVPNNVVNER